MVYILLGVIAMLLVLGAMLMDQVLDNQKQSNGLRNCLLIAYRVEYTRNLQILLFQGQPFQALEYWVDRSEDEKEWIIQHAPGWVLEELTEVITFIDTPEATALAYDLAMDAIFDAKEDLVGVRL